MARNPWNKKERRNEMICGLLFKSRKFFLCNYIDSCTFSSWFSFICLCILMKIDVGECLHELLFLFWNRKSLHFSSYLFVVVHFGWSLILYFTIFVVGQFHFYLIIVSKCWLISSHSLSFSSNKLPCIKSTSKWLNI